MIIITQYGVITISKSNKFKTIIKYRYSHSGLLQIKTQKTLHQQHLARQGARKPKNPYHLTI